MSRLSFEVRGLRKVVGGNISRLRRRKGMSQSVLAETTGLTRGSVCNIEVGRQRAQIETLYAIAEALDTKLDVLLRGV